MLKQNHDSVGDALPVVTLFEPSPNKSRRKDMVLDGDLWVIEARKASFDHLFLKEDIAARQELRALPIQAVGKSAEMLQGLSRDCEICADQPLARKIG